MNSIKALIVDDESASRNNLKKLLVKSCPELQIIGMAKSVPDAVVNIREKQPQLVFMDVEMPEYAGYEIIKFIDNIEFYIIFVTAYSKYAVKAFQLNAIDYLLKPIDRHLLEEAVQKVQTKIQEKHAAESYQSLLQTMEGSENKTLVVSELNKRSIIQLNDIVAIEAQGAYSHIHLQDSELKVVSKNIGYFVKLLGEEPQFYRSHKSWLINTRWMVGYTVSTQSVELECNIIAKLSRLKKVMFEARFING